MCIVQLPPGDNPLAVNKYIISYVFFHDSEFKPISPKEKAALAGTITRIKVGVIVVNKLREPADK